MYIKPLPPKDYLNECFCYLKDGTIARKARPESHFATARGWEISLSRVDGKPIGSLGNNGYLQVGVDYLGKKCSFAVHRVIWTMHYGEIPEGYQIDHWDTDRLNNKIGNLRLATDEDNQHNLNLTSKNTSGVKGVSWSKSHKAWQGQICSSSIRIHLGYFETVQDAEVAVKKARIELHQEFKNHG